jgi:hypothetical protein
MDEMLADLISEGTLEGDRSGAPGHATHSDMAARQDILDLRIGPTIVADHRQT